jgi:acetylornithine deacetylase
MDKAKVQEEISGRVENLLEEEVDFLSRLISFKSLVGQEGPAQQFYGEACRDLGLEVEYFEAEKEKIKSHPGYIEIGIDYAGRPNVIARTSGAGKGRSLILNGHIDVVSAEPQSLWSGDPWQARREGHRLFGRAAVDMKAGLAANYFALKAILDCGIKLNGQIILESVIEEEAGGSGGTLACFLHGVTADGMIISEPTQEKVIVTHPGIKYFRVTVYGKTAHAALSHTGVNAIVKMMPIVKAIEELDLQRAKRLSYPLVEKATGRPCNLSLGKMQAGDWVSTVAGWATLEGRVGFVPGETREQIVAEVENTVRHAVQDDPWFKEFPVKIEWFGWDTDPWLEPQDSSLIKEFQAGSQKVYGAVPEIAGASGGLDSRFGHYFNVPSISFGPTGANYHGIDEYVEIPSMLRVTKALALFVADWCGIAK